MNDFTKQATTYTYGVPISPVMSAAAAAAYPADSPCMHMHRFYFKQSFAKANIKFSCLFHIFQIIL